MNLKIRFSIITLLLLIISSIFTYSQVERIVSSIVEKWGRQIVEIQVLNDSARILQPLEREIEIARDMANNEWIQNLARNPENNNAKQKALMAMEEFRQKFRSQSYFTAFKENGAYYHNNNENEYENRQLRYYLDRNDQADIWFYRLLDEGLDFHLNVNPDEELGITNLWIDILMRDKKSGDEGEVLGVTGTGISLDDFLTEVVNIHKTAVTTLFVDQYGAIQLYRDPELIDYASFVKPEHQKHTIDLLIGDSKEQEQTYEIMNELLEPDNHQKIKTVKVNVEGKKTLAGIAYLPTIGWYEISLLDIEEIMPVSQFIPATAVFILVLVSVLFILNMFLRIEIFNPLTHLQKATEHLTSDSRKQLNLPTAKGEIKLLIESFSSMADAISNQTVELERQVEERTLELKEMMLTDPLTMLLNRRGMNEKLQEHVQRSKRTGEAFGLVCIDIDYFKNINDSQGHAAGDKVLTSVSLIFSESVRPYDHVARWGGDEFLILLSPADDKELEKISERLINKVRNWSDEEIPSITISLGGTTSKTNETINEVLQRADDALYHAKNKGRNRFEIV